MIYTHVLKVAGGGVRSPLDVLEASLGMALDGALAGRRLAEAALEDERAGGPRHVETQEPRGAWDQRDTPHDTPHDTPAVAPWRARMPLGPYVAGHRASA